MSDDEEDLEDLEINIGSKRTAADISSKKMKRPKGPRVEVEYENEEEEPHRIPQMINN